MTVPAGFDPSSDPPGRQRERPAAVPRDAATRGLAGEGGQLCRSPEGQDEFVLMPAEVELELVRFGPVSTRIEPHMSDPATPVADPETDTRSKVLPPYHVIIENDDHHSQIFVVLVLRKVFGYDDAQAIDLMHTAERGRRGRRLDRAKGSGRAEARPVTDLPRKARRPRPRPGRLPDRARS